MHMHMHTLANTSIGPAPHMPGKPQRQPAQNKHLLPTPVASSRESSAARPQQLTNSNETVPEAQDFRSARTSLQEGAGQVEEIEKEGHQEEVEKVLQPQPKGVKRKRGRPCIRPHSESVDSQHVKVQVVPTPKQAEWLRQHQQKQAQKVNHTQGAVARTVVPVAANGQDAQYTAAASTQDQVSGNTQSSQKPLQWHGVLGMGPGNDVSSQTEAQPARPQANPFVHWAPRQDEPSRTQQSLSSNGGYANNSQTNSTDKNTLATLAPKPLPNGVQDQTAAMKNATKTALTSGASRSGKPGRAESVMTKNAGVQKSNVQKKRAENSKKNVNTTACGEEEEGAATGPTTKHVRFSLDAGAKKEGWKETIATPSNGNQMSRKGKGTDATEDLPSRQVSSAASARAKRPVPLEYSQAKLPKHVTRWHDLGFETFEYLDLDTKQWEHRVVLRSGKANNTLGYWYNLFLGQRASAFPDRVVAEICLNLQRTWEAGNVEKMVCLADKELVLPTAPGPVVGLGLQEIIDAEPGAVEMAPMRAEPRPYGTAALKTADRKLVQTTHWDFLLMEAVAKGKLWRKRRRQRYFEDKWREAAWAETEIRARSRSRGAFVEDKEEVEHWKSRPLVRHENSEVDGWFVIPEKPLTYRRDGTSRIATNWMGRDEINTVILPGEVTRSKPTQIGMQEDGKPLLKMLFAKIGGYGGS